MKKKLSLSIGIPAYNEEKNISHLLSSIISQRRGNYSLESIVVACDASKDNTKEIVQKYQKKYKVIKLIDGKIRIGKSERIKGFYKLNKSDILITLDGDIALANNNFINEILTLFKDEKVGLVGAKDLPCTPQNLFEKIAFVANQIWFETRKDLMGGDSLHNCHACALAIRKEVSKKIHIPNGLIADDDYIYFKTLEAGYRFKFATDTIVYFRLPNNPTDYLIQSSRFLKLKNFIANNLGDWVYSYYKVPAKYKIKGLCTMFLKEPLFTPLAIILEIASRLVRAQSVENRPKGLWTPVKSTKIIYAK